MSQRDLLGKTDCETTRTQLIKRQAKLAHYYNQNCGPLSLPTPPSPPPPKKIESNQPVRVHDHHSQTWQSGTVLKLAKEPRSYVV